jgi:protoheme IX farnesyltransferase
MTVLLQLGKVKITLAVTVSTLTGYLLASGRIDTDAILPALGIFLMACGSSAMNQYQERENDARMTRTKNRPIPAGKVTPTGALVIAFLYILAGGLLLFLGPGFLALQLGLLALIWYNAIYTPLKRRTAFAVVPGAVIGAIPPVVGWVAGGGKLFDPQALILAFYFFIWQVPHFWLLAVYHNQDYEEAGYPTLRYHFSEHQIKRITFAWILATAVTSLLLPLYGIISSTGFIIVLFALSLLTTVSFRDMLINRDAPLNTRRSFMKINVYFLGVIVIIWLDRLL